MPVQHSYLLGMALAAAGSATRCMSSRGAARARARGRIGRRGALDLCVRGLASRRGLDQMSSWNDNAIAEFRENNGVTITGGRS